MDSPELDDSELLRRARVDADAFGVFYRRHARAVYRSLLSACGDPDVALDLTAETFARALQSVGRFRGVRVESGRAWIFAIANSLPCSTSASAASRTAPAGGSGSSRRRASTPTTTRSSRARTPRPRASASRT